jgi:hypothetical protein
MLTENDKRTDGKFISYLDNKKKFSTYDPELFNILSACIKSNLRNVNVCLESNIICNVAYYNSILSDNINQREKYFVELKDKAQSYDLVFLDPDNGIEIKSKPRGTTDSSKYLYYDEIINLYKQGNSLLLYQHYIREDRLKFIQRISDKLKETTGCPIILPLKTSNVVYFLVPQVHLIEYFKQRIKLLSSTWLNEITIPLGFI